MIAAIAAVGVVAIVGLVISVRIERETDLTLPAPTGPYAVGRSIFAWADPATVDALAPAPGSNRELLVWIWYPAAGPSSSDEYVPAAMRAAAGAPGGVLGFLTRDFSKVRGRSADDAELSPSERSYPVAILRGGASAPVVNYTTLAEDLASHGYIVAGIDAPYRTNVVVFPDGRVLRRTSENNPELCDGPQKLACFDRLLNAWTADIGFVLDRLTQLNASDPMSRFTGRIDLMRVGVFGHSFGGSQAAQFCHDDRRCKAGIDIDGIPLGSVIREGMQQPFMFVFSAQIHALDPASRLVQADIQSIYDRLPVDDRLRVSIRGSTHFTFSDDGALLKSRVVRGLLRALGALRIDGPRQLAVTAYCVRTFFDSYLKRAGEDPPRLATTEYPEIEVL